MKLTPTRVRVGHILLLLSTLSFVVVVYVTNAIVHRYNVYELLSWDYHTPSAIEIIHLESPLWLQYATAVNITIPALREQYHKAFQYTDAKSMPTNASNSVFMISDLKSHYSLCDTIRVTIVSKDVNNKTKTSGGDYFFANIYNFGSRASSPPDGDIVDHGDGRYTVKFTLRWVGTIKINIFLVHSAEAVTALRRVRDNFPARQIFLGRFVSNKTRRSTMCHITPHMYVNSWENASLEIEMCNFTDPLTGLPWFCIKPTGFPCSAYREHSQTDKGGEPLLHLMDARERGLFVKPLRLPGAGPSSIRVTSNGSKTSTCLPKELPDCTIGQPRTNIPTSGFYFKELWVSLNCKMKYFSNDESKRCLANRVIYFLGDSTIRQWFTYLVEKFDDVKLKNKFLYNTNYRMGDDIWRNRRHNITMHYHHHGFPNMIKWVNTTDMHYIANMIDQLPANTGTVLYLSLAAHFTITNLEFFRARLNTVKNAVSRLLSRNPDIPVFIKTANTRDLNLIDESNWYHNELNHILKEEMTDVNVTVLDVWGMTACHWTMFHIHPNEEILKNEIDMALSYLCPSLDI